MLTKSELASIGDGGKLTNSTVFMYRVFGITGEDVYLWNPSAHTPSWQIRRFKDDKKTDWYGDHATADEALAALQKEVDDAKAKR